MPEVSQGERRSLGGFEQEICLTEEAGRKISIFFAATHQLFLQNTLPGTWPAPQLLHRGPAVLALKEQAQKIF